MTPWCQLSGINWICSLFNIPRLLRSVFFYKYFAASLNFFPFGLLFFLYCLCQPVCLPVCLYVFFSTLYAQQQSRSPLVNTSKSNKTKQIITSRCQHMQHGRYTGYYYNSQWESSPVENIIYDPKHSFLACSTQATHRIWTISNRFAGYNGHLHIIYYDYIDPLTPPFRILSAVGVCTYYSGANKLIPISISTSNRKSPKSEQLNIGVIN